MLSNKFIKMVAKEFYLGQISIEEEKTGDEESTLLQDSHDDSDAEEAEEALSLCDLPLYSNNSSISAQWGDGNNNFSKEYEKSSSQSIKEEEEDDDDDDFFEFFSEDFTTSSNSTTIHHHRTVSDNIIFCGKLIPFKDTPKNIDESNNKIKKGMNTFASWRSNSTSRSNSKAMMMTCNNNKDISHGGAKGNNNFTSSSSCEYSSIGKVSLLRSPTKSRWFLFMFGMTRLSTSTGNMELRDIRNRQSRNSRRTKLAAAAAPENKGEVVEKMMKEGEGKGKGNCKGLWKVLRSISTGLGCSSSSSKLANDVVKAAFV